MVRARSFWFQIYRLEGRLAQNQVEERGVVGLDHKEEDFLKRDAEELWTNDDVNWVAPYTIAN